MTPDVPPAGGRPPPFWRRRAVLLAGAAAVGVLVAGVVTVQQRDDGPAPLTRSEAQRAIKSSIEKAQQEQREAPPDAATAYRRIVPSLVTIVTAGKAKGSGSAATGDSLGSGVVINAQGSVLTALHVVADGGEIQVRFADGTRATAQVLQRQPENDIAVLSVDQLPEVIVPAVMGGGVQVGDAVFPVGNPLGLEGSLTAGVISALDRSIRPIGGTPLKGLLQFDGAVNPGNSGGPLLDRNGQVVGIVTGLANPSRQPYFVGIGFAVPIATAGGVAGGPSK
jgi:S1-C subfamily serine protease